MEDRRYNLSILTSPADSLLLLSAEVQIQNEECLTHHLPTLRQKSWKTSVIDPSDFIYELLVSGSAIRVPKRHIQTSVSEHDRAGSAHSCLTESVESPLGLRLIKLKFQ
jgi:hypothetical protein